MIMVRCKSAARLLGFRLIFKADTDADADADADAHVMRMISYDDPGARKRTGRLVSD